MPNIDWDAKSYPGSYQPVQLDSSKYTLPCSCIDWWSKRSCLCCACFPLAHCINGRCNPCLAQTVDALDPEIYKKTLQIKTFCPEEMRGVWWLEDNLAHETLVIFNDAKWLQSEDNPAIWEFFHDLPQTWFRDPTLFGYILGIAAAWKINDSKWTEQWQSFVPIVFNFDKGKAYLKNFEWIFRINEDEWQKAAFKVLPDGTVTDEVGYMYRWRRVMRGDGSLTSAWADMEAMMKRPYRNFFDPWCPCWPLCIPVADRNIEMGKSGGIQVGIFRPEERTATFSGCCCLPPCPCPCMCPLFAKVDGQWAEQFGSASATSSAPAQQEMGEGYQPIAQN
ncbi:unnamed protein product [Symbiodinium microadriaticum]|nr:unnamed protein product [Symbiodinium microadriaticum]CAE7315430.1 unnamed protein product [Symbiodinium sp. KB8]